MATKSGKKRKKAKKKLGTPDLKSFLTHKLRRISYQWAPRREAIKNARTERGVYKCAKCEGSFGPKEIQLDHIVPIVDPHLGFQNWEDFISKLFCDADGFQVLCRTCHSYKTGLENEVRRQTKRANTKDDDEDDI